MGRQAPPVAYNEKMLASLATRLERAAARLRAVRDQVDRDKKLDRLYIFNHKSMTLAVESVEAFSFETEKAWDALERGERHGCPCHRGEDSQARSSLPARPRALTHPGFSGGGGRHRPGAGGQPISKVDASKLDRGLPCLCRARGQLLAGENAHDYPCRMGE